MIWKMSIYLLLIALPAGIFTSIVDVKETRNEISKMIAENTSEHFEEDIKTDGAILGSVIAPNADITIKGIDGIEMVKGTTNEFGEFFINGFEKGTYDIIVEAKSEGNLEIYKFDDVEIGIGEVTALGTVNLEE
ncbi:carboxypeptidase-like regulatory domain-containing protein [Jejudonia soesokkakensis]|uniref:Carboxypeptidase-like regulatory domain-containing protein n=1 Tax=Jejudonia soesokkakensis TaxID=1323432 RepID=A0ABW2MMH1_9FLAO